ncbi:uracil-DNA glycosylase, mitochondrial [Cucurbita pepo subsp. pepo]|uniref:uracil-DNA glycosylase, mitochondrial n=1 Tax=Cucurbita pepo subsp. pepo TaxID=3664 RepID=UPI000C9D6B82|nr:uracil-DNA glycosylase, mitochondrial [Cucurbita pepo subsp. pepo]
MASFSPSLKSKTRTLIDIFQPALSKRLKTSQTLKTLATTDDKCDSELTLASSSMDISSSQKSRMETNKWLARSKRNLKISSDRVSKWENGCVKLEELLVDETWFEALPGEFEKPYALNLCKFVETEICSSGVPVYPPPSLIFNALNSTPFDRVKVVILGQDPYHGPGQAMGLSFSVPEGVKIPSSLLNIFKELREDLGCSIPSHGNLEKWAVQGVLLLNAVLTVRKHQANSHAKKGWEQFTDAVIQTISQKKEGVVFLLWGNSAQAKLRLIDEKKHHILKAAHPSGLSANRGFFGCRHFSRTNMLLKELGIGAIDWQL